MLDPPSCASSQQAVQAEKSFRLCSLRKHLLPACQSTRVARVLAPNRSFPCAGNSEPAPDTHSLTHSLTHTHTHTHTCAHTHTHAVSVFLRKLRAESSCTGAMCVGAPERNCARKHQDQSVRKTVVSSRDIQQGQRLAAGRSGGLNRNLTQSPRRVCFKLARRHCSSHPTNLATSFTGGVARVRRKVAASARAGSSTTKHAKGRRSNRGMS